MAHPAAGKLGIMVGRIGLLNSNSPRANGAEIVDQQATRGGGADRPGIY